MIWNKRMKKILFILITMIIISFINPKIALAAKNLKIIDYGYSTHFMPGETVNFSTVIQNNEPDDQWGEVDIVLTNQATGTEVDPYSIASDTFAAGTTGTLSNFQQQTPVPAHNWSATEGTFTVTFILYDGNADESHRVYGSEPIRVGRAEDYVSAFPNIVDFGVLPYGRYMLPHPIRIHWNFYLRNRLRKDHPWYMRIYTDNSTKYKGIEGAIYQNRRVYITSKIWVRTNVEGSPSGLVSSDGKYTIPLRVWCLNYGPDWEETGWNPNMLGPPPVNDDYVWKGPLLDDGKRDNDRRAWLWIPDYADMTSDRRTWRSLIGRDPYNVNFVGDNNPTGDFTLDNPFDIYFATEASPATVMGKYSGTLIIEIYTP